MTSVSKTEPLRIQMPQYYVEYMEILVARSRIDYDGVLSRSLAESIAVNYHARQKTPMGNFCRNIKQLRSAPDIHEGNPVFAITFGKVQKDERPSGEPRHKSDPWSVVMLPAGIVAVIKGAAQEMNMTQSDVVIHLLKTAFTLHAITGLLHMDGDERQYAKGMRYWDIIKSTSAVAVTSEGGTAYLTLLVGSDPDATDGTAGRPDRKERIPLRQIMADD